MWGYMKLYLRLASIVLILSSCASHQAAYHSLTLEGVKRLGAPGASKVSVTSEISGTAIVDQKELFVTDEVKDHYIYELKKTKSDRDYQLSVWLDLNEIKAFKKYRHNLKKITKETLDMEGMTACESAGHQTIFIINERVRDIFRINIENKKKTFTSIGQPIRDYIKLGHLDAIASVLQVNKKIKGSDDKEILFARDYTKTPLFGNPGDTLDNAGYEGIAADCKNKVLYIAKERQPRYIIKTDFDGNVHGLFTIPESSRQYHAVKDPFTGEGSFVTEPDISDLFFLQGDSSHEGSLFVLERNSGEITELNPNIISDQHQMQLIARYDYAPWEFIYDEVTSINQIAPFGMAETLRVEKGDKKTFYIGFDNGGVNKLNEKGFSVLGCGNSKDTQNCLEKQALNAVVLTLQEK